jgi:AcrR family transcriptional regulator
MAKKASPTTKDQRSVIIEHAAKLFQQKGYHAATMDDLAAAVQLNKATVYYYFESKANLLFEIILGVSEENLAMIRALPSDLPPQEMLRRFIVDTVVFLGQHPVESSVSFQEASFMDQWLGRDQVQMIRSRQREFEDHAASIVRAGQKDGMFDSELDSRLVAEALTGMVSWFVRWYRPGGRMSPRAVGEQWSVLTLQGLVPRGPARPSPAKRNGKSVR